MQIYVLSHQSHANASFWVSHTVEQDIPFGPVHVPETQAEASNHVGVQPFFGQSHRDLVNRRRIATLDHGLAIHVAHQSDLVLDPLVELTIASQHDGVWLDADVAQGSH